MGQADDWQSALSEQLANDDVLLLNPRRTEWDASWEQSIDNPHFLEQVEWELEAMETADCIAMHFCPETQSPITLLELGLHAKSGKLIVLCPLGFWRKGNVDVLCQRYNITTVESLAELVQEIRNRVC